MAAKKVKDLAVKTGSYTVNGETKGRYKNVGSMMKSDDGSYFLLLDKTFNPAGVPGDPDRDNILISVFDLRDDAAAGGGSGGARGGAPQRQRPEQAAAGPANTAQDDDIPFIRNDCAW